MNSNPQKQQSSNTNNNNNKEATIPPKENDCHHSAGCFEAAIGSVIANSNKWVAQQDKIAHHGRWNELDRQRLLSGILQHMLLHKDQPHVIQYLIQLCQQPLPPYEDSEIKGESQVLISEPNTAPCFVDRLVTVTHNAPVFDAKQLSIVVKHTSMDRYAFFVGTPTFSSESSCTYRSILRHAKWLQNNLKFPKDNRRYQGNDYIVWVPVCTQPHHSFIADDPNILVWNANAFNPNNKNDNEKDSCCCQSFSRGVDSLALKIPKNIVCPRQLNPDPLLPFEQHQITSTRSPRIDIAMPRYSMKTAINLNQTQSYDNHHLLSEKSLLNIESSRKIEHDQNPSLQEDQKHVNNSALDVKPTLMDDFLGIPLFKK